MPLDMNMVDSQTYITSQHDEKIWFVTGNAGKIHEAKYAISDVNFAGSMNYHMTEIQSDDCHDIITRKAQSFIDNAIKNWPVDKTELFAIVEDTGLECANMNGFPGPYIRYYFDKLGLDGICSFNGGSPATFVSHSAGIRLTNIDSTKGEVSIVMKIFETRVNGVINTSSRGEKGFGFDPIFIPNGCYQTLGEMDLPEKLEYSARMQSIRSARDWILTAVIE